MPDPASFKAPIGTRDVLPPESSRWIALLAVFAEQAEAAGYRLLHTPVFEDAAVFTRLGEGTDVVRKEMYEFEDRGGRRLALRPEVTASVVRAFVQHRPPTPWKVWTATPCFRYEAPQAGRYRQHHQVDIEIFGTDDPDADVEVIAVGHDYLRALGLRRITLLLNSMGTPADRPAYTERLRAWLQDAHRPSRPGRPDQGGDQPDAGARQQAAGDPAGRRPTRPRITDHLSDEARLRFERVQEGLGRLGVDFVIEPRLVRGLDYYTHTTFEFVSRRDRRGPEHDPRRRPLRPPGRGPGRPAHAGHRLRLGHRAGAARLRRRGRLPRTRTGDRRLRRRRRRRRTPPATSRTGCAGPGSAPTGRGTTAR